MSEKGKPALVERKRDMTTTTPFPSKQAKVCEQFYDGSIRYLIEGPENFAAAHWPRDADIATIARCILGTLKYEPHSADTTPLRLALEGVIKVDGEEATEGDTKMSRPNASEPQL